MTAGEDLAVTLSIDGQDVSVRVRSTETLLETMRDRCGHTSVRYCCGIGVCGTCTVLMAGQPVSSCLLLTALVDGAHIDTAEGLAGAPSTPTQPDALANRVHEAFGRAAAFQCSYCIPGMVVTVHALLAAQPRMTREELRAELAGNLCRCGSYPQVLEALAMLAPDADIKEEPSR